DQCTVDTFAQYARLGVAAAVFVRRCTPVRGTYSPKIRAITIRRVPTAREGSVHRSVGPLHRTGPGHAWRAVESRADFLRFGPSTPPAAGGHQRSLVEHLRGRALVPHEFE